MLKHDYKEKGEKHSNRNKIKTWSIFQDNYTMNIFLQLITKIKEEKSR